MLFKSPLLKVYPEQAFVIDKDLLGARYIAGRAFQFNRIRAQVNGDVQAIFQHAHILIPRAK
jgi:hypothetical protein